MDEAQALALTQDQFRELLAAVRPAPPPDVILDDEHDPNVWTWERVRALMASGEIKEVRFVPDESCRIGWNGLYVWVAKDEQNVVPEPHYNVFMESRAGTRQAFANARGTLGNHAGGLQFSEKVGWTPEPVVPQ